MLYAMILYGMSNNALPISFKYMHGPIKERQKASIKTNKKNHFKSSTGSKSQVNTHKYSDKCFVFRINLLTILLHD